MKLSTGIVEFWKFIFKAQFNTAMWGRERKSHDTYHVVCINFSKTKGAKGYAITLVLLPFSLIVGYKFKD